MNVRSFMCTFHIKIYKSSPPPHLLYILPYISRLSPDLTKHFDLGVKRLNLVSAQTQLIIHSLWADFFYPILVSVWKADNESHWSSTALPLFQHSADVLGIWLSGELCVVDDEATAPIRLIWATVYYFYLNAYFVQNFNLTIEQTQIISLNIMKSCVTA